MDQLIRYIFNGILATLVHYAVLSFNLKVVGFASVGFANFAAAIVGIAVSFLGSKYFVFIDNTGKFDCQVKKFLLLYCALIVLHGALLHVWSDILGLPYTYGFILATTLQVCFTYFGNKIYVFSK
jgi:putative flippase GtrA